MPFRYILLLFYVCFKDSRSFLSVLIYYIRIFGNTMELLNTIGYGISSYIFYPQ